MSLQHPMTLDGLTVEEWLCDRPIAFAEPSVAPQEGASGARKPRFARIPTLLIWLVALATGVWFAAPALKAHEGCPPSGEGATYCQLEHSVLKGAMTFLLITAAVVIGCRVILGLPAFVARVRREGVLPRPPSVAMYDDPILLAACRGHVT